MSPYYSARLAIVGISFTMHYVAWHKASTQAYFKDQELRVYMFLLAVFISLVTIALYVTNTFDSDRA